MKFPIPVGQWASGKSRMPSDGVASVSISQEHTKSPFLRMSGVVPGLMVRAIGSNDTKDMSAMQAPWVGVQDVLTQVVNGGIYQAIVQLVHRRSSDEEGAQHARSPRRIRNMRREARQAWTEALKLEKEMDLDGAIEALNRAAEIHPKEILYLARLSKQWSDYSFMDGVKFEQAKNANKKALEIAEQALACDPTNALGHVAVCVSKGRLATFSDNRTKVHLAREAEDSVKEALVIDPKCDIAHHLMGRWNYEMAALNPLARTFVRLVYGTRLSTGSYSGALDCFIEASKLAPHRIIHKVQLGKTYQKLGDREKAVQHLEEATKLELEDINDFLELREGERILKRLKASQSMRWQ